MMIWRDGRLTGCRAFLAVYAFYSLVWDYVCYFGRKWDVSIGEHVSDRRAGFLSTKNSQLCQYL